MSFKGRGFVEAFDSLFTGLENVAPLSDVHSDPLLSDVNSDSVLPDVKNGSRFKEVNNGSLFSEVTNSALFSEIKNITSEWRTLAGELDEKHDFTSLNDNVTQFMNTDNATTRWIATVSRKTVTFVDNVTGNNVADNSASEITISKPEVYEGADFGTAEKVVIGAAVLVAVLAVIAILLRLCRPACRGKTWTEKDSIEGAFGIEVTDSKLSGYTNIEVASNSSAGTGSSQSNDWSQSSGSNPSTDWSDLSSDVPKSLDSAQVEPEIPKTDKQSTVTLPVMPGVHGSSPLLRSIASEDRLSAKSSPLPDRRSNDEVLSVISTHSLEPLRLEQAYRNRWDDQWDPYGSFPRANLSHLCPPSESRLSLNSYSSHSSSTTFPIPSRDTVKQLNSDKSNRYPSNLRLPTATKKEKQVRMHLPADR